MCYQVWGLGALSAGPLEGCPASSEPDKVSQRIWLKAEFGSREGREGPLTDSHLWPIRPLWADSQSPKAVGGTSQSYIHLLFTGQTLLSPFHALRHCLTSHTLDRVQWFFFWASRAEFEPLWRSREDWDLLWGLMCASHSAALDLGHMLCIIFWSWSVLIMNIS